MFRIIDRYIIKEILPYFLLSLFLLTAIIFTREANRFSELFILFSRRGLDSWPLVELIVSLLPGIFVFTIPISLLFGILIGLGRLSSDSEIIVLSACGISRWRLFTPVFVFSLLVTTVSWYNTGYFLPDAVKSLISLKSTRSRLFLEGIANQVKPGVFEESIPQKVILVRDLNKETGKWHQIFVAEELDQSSEPRVMVAKSGELIIGQTLELSELHLYEGFIYDAYQRKRREHNKATASSFGETTLRFNLNSQNENNETSDKSTEELQKELENRENKNLREALNRPEAKTVEELLQSNQPEENTKRLRWETEIQKRFALPFGCLVFSLISVALSLSVSRGGRSAGMVTGIAVTISYYLMVMVGEDLARQGVVPVVFGVWSPNLTFTLIGTLFLTRYQKITDSAAWFISKFNPIFEFFRKLSTDKKSVEKIPSIAHRVTFGFPRLIDRMLLGEVTKYFFMVLFGITSVFLIFTLFDLTNNIFENRIKSDIVFGYLVYLTPQIFHYTAPFAMLVSVLVTFGLFGKTSQLVALNASGQSLYRLAMPVLLYSIVMGGFLFLSQEYVLPFTNRRQEYLRYVIKGGNLPAQTFYQANRTWFLAQENRLIHFRHFDHQKNQIAGIAIYELDEQRSSLTRRISANEASWDAATQEWILAQGFVRTFEGVDVKTAERFKELRIKIPEKPEYFKQQTPESSKMNISQLVVQIEQLKLSGIDVLNLEIALQTKFASPLTCLVMALLGIPFALTIGKRGALAGVGISIFIAIAFWGAMEMFGQMGRYEILPPMLSAWGANLLFSASGLYLLFTTKT